MILDANDTDAFKFDLSQDRDDLAASIAEGIRAGHIPTELKIDPENVSHDLAKLVLTLIEFVRQLLEAQAIRRMENGSLSDQEEENLGLTLYQAREKIIELADSFGIQKDELTMDLGPLGRLV